MSILKPIDHSYAKASDEKIRAIFEDARLKARMGHDRTECPHDGLPSLRDHPKTLDRRRFFRKVWLTGYDLEKAAMEQEEEEANAPKPDPVKIKWHESNQLSRRYGGKRSSRPRQDVAEAPQRSEGAPSLEELEAIAARRLKGKGAR